jgi:hypothetical protein
VDLGRKEIIVSDNRCHHGGGCSYYISALDPEQTYCLEHLLSNLQGQVQVLVAQNRLLHTVIDRLRAGLVEDVA